MTIEYIAERVITAVTLNIQSAQQATEFAVDDPKRVVPINQMGHAKEMLLEALYSFKQQIIDEVRESLKEN